MRLIWSSSVCNAATSAGSLPIAAVSMGRGVTASKAERSASISAEY